jgi:3-oxoacyl-[acyl-carrier-protein] synthase II
MRRRVAVTGMGVVCPLGGAVEAVWASVMAGRSAIASRTFTNAATGTSLTVPAAGIPDAALRPVPKSDLAWSDRFGRLALMAAADAIADAGLQFEREDRSRIGVSSGTCMGGITETEVGFNAIYLRHRPKVHPFTVLRTMYNAPTALVAAAHKLTGPALAYSTTCSSSSVAIGEAARQIRHGYADVMVAGGAESLLTYSAINCWYSAQLLAPLHDDPAQSCRPFDATRNGTVLGEGAAYVVLEDWDHAVARGARIHAELAGYGCSADVNHLTQPSVAGQASSMRLALADAGMDGGAVGYVNAHGTATRLNDEVETNAIKQVFGSHATHLAVSSTKSMVGHMVGAAGAMGLLMCVKAVTTAQVPPTANLKHPDPECDLDYVPDAGRSAPHLRVAISNAFGFGGTAASLVVAKCP